MMGILLRCIANHGIHEAMSEVYSDIYDAHQSGPNLYMQLKRLPYYWPTMFYDCMEFAKRCQTCQYHGNFIRLPPEPLQSTTHLWPFASWGIEIVRPFEKAMAREYEYILVATDYFSKWIEAIAIQDFTTVTSLNSSESIIYPFGVPETITTNNGQYFKSTTFYKLYTKY